MVVFCSKCNRKISNLREEITLSGINHSQVLCEVCAKHYKLVKRPIKRKLTKKEKFEKVAFVIIGLFIVFALLAWIIYSIIIDIKEGKTSKTFPWMSLSLLIFFFFWNWWGKRVKRLEKESKGKCCANNDCDLNKDEEN